MKKSYIIFIILSLFLISCSNSGSSSETDINWWKEIIWDQTEDGKYASFKYNELKPSCSNGPDSITSDFSFFVKEGIENKLVIFFQGGGACWHYNNCILEATYNPGKRFEENVYFLDLMANQSPLAVMFDFGGIFNFVNGSNPFKDWHIVYIPYCTADLHSGAADKEYTKNGDSAIIRHRGNVNFQLVLKWLKDNYTSDPEIIFMTGQSSGSYGSIFNYAYVRETFATSEMYHLGDSGNGVLHDEFQQTGLPNWNIQIPDIKGFSDFSTDFTIHKLYSDLANHYTSDTFAQFSSAWDKTQTFFYNVMLNIEDPGTEGSNWESYDDVRCHWNNQLITNLDLTESTPGIDNNNYKYYIAPGSRHTILMSNEIYSTQSNGVPLVDWIASMLEKNSSFLNVICTDDCGKPEESPDCP